MVCAKEPDHITDSDLQTEIRNISLHFKKYGMVKDSKKE